MNELRLLEFQIQSCEHNFLIIIKDINDRLNNIEDKLNELEFKVKIWMTILWNGLEPDIVDIVIENIKN